MKRRRTVSSLLVLVFLLGAPLAARAQPLADRVPDDALLYIGWRGADDPGPGFAKSSLKGFLDASALPQVVNDLLPKVLDKMAEKDRGAAILRELVAKLGPSFWRSPTALYVGPVDGLSVGQPVPRIALLCQAGAAAPQLKKDINSYLDQILAGAPIPVMAVEENGIVAVTLGNVVPDLAGKSGTTLAHRKEFTDAMAQVGKDPLLAVYADVESAAALIDHAITAIPQAVEKWAMIRDTLGLRGLKRIAWTAGFDGREFATQGFILAPAPRTGLLQLIDSGPLSDDALRAVPQSATMVVAGKLDFAKLLGMFRDITVKLDPAAPDRINSGIALANLALGINLENDLIKPIGDTWIAYTSPTIGGVGPLGFVVVNRARDAAQLEKSLTALEQLINGKINATTAAGQPRGNFVRATVDGVSVHYMNTPFVTPGWAIKNGNLYVALYPQTVAAAANAPAGSSILNNEAFVGARKRLGAEQASAISFFDLPRTAPTGYPYVLAASRVLGFADMFGMQTPPAVLPSLDKLMPLMSPAASAAWTDETGLHTRSITPFPGATLFGGAEALLVEAPSVVVGIAMPAYQKARAAEAQAAERRAPAAR